MDSKLLNHAYHRSRVDAHISLSIGLVMFMVVLAFLAGDKFRPFQQGANFWSPTLLVWNPETDAWVPLRWLRQVGGLQKETDTYHVISPPGPEASATQGDVTAPGDLPDSSDDTDDPESAQPEEEAAAVGAGSATADEPTDDEEWEAEAMEPKPSDEGALKYIVNKVGHRPDPTLQAVITMEIHPTSYSVVFVFAVLAGSWFLYRCARRQAMLMLSVYHEEDENRPYDRPWEEIRVTFWGLLLVLLAAVFLFLL